MNYTAPAGVALEAGSGQPHQRWRPPLHRRIAGNSDHLCTSSDNDLHSGRLDSSSDRLRASATVKRSSPPSSYGGRPGRPRADNEAIKAKESGAQQQMVLMPSPAVATTSARGSLTSGCDHLSTDDSGHLCTSRRRLPQHARRGPRSRLTNGSEDKTIQERRRYHCGVRRLV
jgi:hypothetical protein